MDFCAGEGKVPVAGKGFRRGKGYVAVVDCGETEEDVAGEDNGSEPDWRVWLERWVGVWRAGG